MITIENKSQCCGCSACAQICGKRAISMKRDAEGFLYPEVQASLCVECGLCEKVCPVLHSEKEQKKEQKGYVVQNKDAAILRESTSGGAFTAIASYVLKQNGIVFGAVFDEKFRVHHAGITSEQDLFQFRNSKYVQSEIRDTFQQVQKQLKTDRLVCFSGTPCQIEGLKQFLRKDYENLITVDVVCRAVPSPLILEKYKKLFKQEMPIKALKFRDKTCYGYEYSQMAVTTQKKTYHQGVETDPYLRAFFSNLSDRPSCYACAFKKRYRVSDLTIWDCFEPQKFCKKLDNNAGATRILVHSDKGKALMQQILPQFYYAEVPADDLVAGVREMVHPVSAHPDREAFFADANLMNEQEFFQKWFPDTWKVKTERTLRHTAEKLGVYRSAKRTVKKLIKRK